MSVCMFMCAKMIIIGKKKDHQFKGKIGEGARKRLKVGDLKGFDVRNERGKMMKLYLI